MSLDLILVDTVETTVYDVNITHNLNLMASEAGVYKVLWRPDENEIFVAGQLIKPIKKALQSMEKDPAHFKQFNPENGWGSYEGFLEFLKNLLEACIDHPYAKIHVSR